MTGRGRYRDPARRERILIAAAELVAKHGYHSVSMSDIGTAAGIVGSGVYRHFDSKAALLVALLDRVMQQLLHNAAQIVAETASEQATLAALVSDQVAFAIEDRRLLQVYQREIHNLPAQDGRRLRRMQRRYIEQWVQVVTTLRPESSEAEIRMLVHSAIGAIQSVLFFRSELATADLAALLTDTAHACLGVAPPTERVTPPSPKDASSEAVERLWSAGG
jgi:AcrR family transcriptional regulator